MHLSQRARARQQKRLRRYAANSNSYTFFNLLTDPDYFDQVERLPQEHQERLFPPTETLSMFLPHKNIVQNIGVKS